MYSAQQVPCDTRTHDTRDVGRLDKGTQRCLRSKTSRPHKQSIQEGAREP